MDLTNLLLIGNILVVIGISLYQKGRIDKVEKTLTAIDTTVSEVKIYNDELKEANRRLLQAPLGERLRAMPIKPAILEKKQTRIIPAEVEEKMAQRRKEWLEKVNSQLTPMPETVKE